MNTLIAFGSEIKSFQETPDGYEFEGELVVFDHFDHSGTRDKFTKATEYFVEEGAERPVVYHHGMDGTMGKAKIGSAQVFVRDAAVWVKGQLKKRTDYLEKHIETLAEAMKRSVEVQGLEFAPFGLSSGAAAHLVERERVGGGSQIKSWPISEVSITPTPMGILTSCRAVKSFDELKAEMSQSSDFGANGEFQLQRGFGTEFKAGRALSGQNHARLSRLLGALQDAKDELAAFLDEHGEDDQSELRDMDFAPFDASRFGAGSFGSNAPGSLSFGGAQTIGGAQTKSCDGICADAQIQNSMLGFELQLAEFFGR